MGIDFSKFKEAIKKFANKPSTSDVNRSSNSSSSNTSSSSNFSSNTYESNIFYDEQIGSPSFDNKIKQELEEKGYNVEEDIQTSDDIGQNGEITDEEYAGIAGLDGEDGISNEDIEEYLKVLDSVDIESLGDTADEIIASAENKLPLLDFNDPEVEEKLFDFLGVEIVDGEYVLNSDDPMRKNIYETYISGDKEQGIKDANNLIQRINDVNSYQNDEDLSVIVNYYNRNHGVNSNLPEVEDIGSPDLDIYEITNLEYLTAEIDSTGESPLKMYKDDKALVTALYVMNSLYPSEHTETIADLNNKFHRVPSYNEGANSLLGISPFEFSQNIITETETIYDLYNELGYEPEIVYDETTGDITQVVVTDANNNRTIVTINSDGSFSVETSLSEPQNDSKIEYNSDVLILTELNKFGEELSVDTKNQNPLIKSLTSAPTCEEAYEIIVTYCNGDTKTADKMYEALYGTTDKKENNIYEDNSAGLVDRMFDVQNGKQVLSPDFLNSFNSSVKNEDGTTTSTNYSIVNNELCITTDNIYTITSLDGNPITSTRISVTTDSSGNVTDEKTLTYNYAYKTENGEQVIDDKQTMVTIHRDGQEDITEPLNDYYKRFAIESAYGINTNMSTEDVNVYYYQVYQNDVALSKICPNYITGRDSEGFFDARYNDIKNLLGIGIIPEDVEEEIIQRALMTTAIKDFYDGNVDRAIASCEDELFRRIYNAADFNEMYHYALDFYGDEKLATEFITNLIKNDNLQIGIDTDYAYASSGYIPDFESIIIEEVPASSGYYSLKSSSEKGGETANIPISSINFKNRISAEDFDTAINISFDSVGATIPANANAIYSFYTQGGEVDYNTTILEYETALEKYNDYAILITQTESVEETLVNTEIGDIINFFTPTGGSIEDGITGFNNYYHYILGDDENNNAYASYNAETGEIEITLLCNGEDFKITLPYNSETNSVEPPENYMYDNEYTTVDGIFYYINSSINDDNLYSQSEFKTYRAENSELINTYATEYAKHILKDEDLKKQYAEKLDCDVDELTEETLKTYLLSDEHCYDESEFFMKYSKDKAYDNLYGNNRANEILNEYAADIGSYSSKISQIATYTCIGLSVFMASVCPPAAGTLMKAALYTGYIDNGIDLGNMLTNKQKDDYADWTLNLAKEYVMKQIFKGIGKLAGTGAEATTKWASKNWSFMANNSIAQKVFNWMAEASIETAISIPYIALLNHGEVDLSWEFIQNMAYDAIPYLHAGAFEMNGIKQGEIFDESGVKYRLGENNERFYFDENNHMYKQVVDGKTIEFDENGRTTKVIDGDTITKYNYNSDGTIRTVTNDANNNIFERICAADGRIIKGIFIDANGLKTITEYQYDTNCVLTEKITTSEADKTVLTTTYDENGRPASDIIKNVETGSETHVGYKYTDGKLSSMTESNLATGETIKTDFDETGRPIRTTVIQYEYKDGYGKSEIADSDGTMLVSYQAETGKTFEVSIENAQKLLGVPKETIEQLAELQAKGWDVDTLMSATGDYTSFRIDGDNRLHIGDKAYTLPEDFTPSMVSKCIAEANGDVETGFKIADDYKAMLDSMDIVKQDTSTETCAISASLSAMVSDSGWGQALLNNITYNADSGKYAIKIGEETFEFNYTAGDNIVETIYREYTSGYSNKTAASDFMQAVLPDSGKLLLSTNQGSIVAVKQVLDNGTGLVTFNIGKDVTATDINGAKTQLLGEHAYVVSKVNDDGSIVLKDTQGEEITVSKEEFERIATDGKGQFEGVVTGKNTGLVDGVTTERAVGAKGISLQDLRKLQQDLRKLQAVASINPADILSIHSNWIRNKSRVTNHIGVGVLPQNNSTTTITTIPKLGEFDTPKTVLYQPAHGDPYLTTLVPTNAKDQIYGLHCLSFYLEIAKTQGVPFRDGCKLNINGHMYTYNKEEGELLCRERGFFDKKSLVTNNQYDSAINYLDDPAHTVYKSDTAYYFRTTVNGTYIYWKRAGRTLFPMQLDDTIKACVDTMYN